MLWLLYRQRLREKGNYFMTPDEWLGNEAVRWLQHAAKDRHAAQVLVELEPSRSVFHSQQAAEKAEKAFLTILQIPFRKTHDLAELGVQCGSADPSLKPIVEDAENLSRYASTFRFPDEAYEPDKYDAAEALAIADKVYPEIRRRVEAR